jgi:hypothetical protein
MGTSCVILTLSTSGYSTASIDEGSSESLDINSIGHYIDQSDSLSRV